MSAARRDLDWSAASARLLFDGDNAVLHSTVRKPSRRGHRSLPAAAARFLCGRTWICLEIFEVPFACYTRNIGINIWKLGGFLPPG
jgi:hypothetical protein